MCSKAEAEAARDRVDQALGKLIDICSGPACQLQRLLGDKEPATKLMPDPLMDPLLEQLFKIP